MKASTVNTRSETITIITMLVVVIMLMSVVLALSTHALVVPGGVDYITNPLANTIGSIATK